MRPTDPVFAVTNLSNMHIRQATLEDVPRIALLAETFWTSSPYQQLGAFDRDRVEMAAIRILQDLGVIFVAEINGRVEGVIAAIVMQHEITFEWYLNEWIWWVEPTHRSGRAGPKLLRALEAWARAQEIRLCKMVAPADSTVGAFYTREGYAPLEGAYIKRLD